MQKTSNDSTVKTTGRNGHTVTIRNLTPHAIKVMGWGTIPPDEVSARVVIARDQIGEINGIPLVNEWYEDITGMPDELRDDEFYVVSRIVYAFCQSQKMPGLDRLICVGAPVRDYAGTIIGCTSFVQPGG